MQNNHTYKIELDNREVLPPKRDEEKEKLRMIFISGIISLIFIGIILYTLPLTVLSWEGLFVYAGIIIETNGEKLELLSTVYFVM